MTKDEINAAVHDFVQKINEALKGNNIGSDIQKAVQALLKNLNVPEVPGR